MISQDALERKKPGYADIIFDVMSFAGGMNSRASQLFLARQGKFGLRQDQLPLLVNMVRTSTGMIQTRYGRIKVNAAAVVPPAGDAVIRSLFELRTQGGTDYVLMNAGNTIYKLTGGNTWTSLGTVANANLRMHWCQFKDVAIGIDGTNSPQRTDGTSIGALGGTPPTNGSAICSHRNRVWILAGRTLSYSALGDEADWTSPNNAGTLPVPTSKGRGGTALLSLWDRLIVWTGDQVFQVTGSGPSDFALEPINIQNGNELSPYGVLAAGNDVYYGSQRGCHSLSIDYSQSITGDVSYNYVSGVIEPTWQDITPGNLANVIGIHDSSRNLLIYLCNRNGNTNNEALVADYYHLDEDGKPTWSMFSNMPFASGAEVYSISNTREVIFGGYDGIVYRQTPIELDNGATIPVQLEYTTDLGVPTFSKLFRYMLLFTNCQEGTITGRISYDFDAAAKTFSKDVGSGGGGALIGSTFIIGTSPLGSGSANFRQHRIGIAGHGRFITVRMDFNGAKRLSIGGMIFFAGLRRVIHH